METIEQLEEKFVYSATQHGLAMQEGGGRKANRWHKQILMLSDKFEENGCKDRLKKFLCHENEYVRLWAACLSIKTYPQESRKVLKQLMKSTDPYVYISAKAILE